VEGRNLRVSIQRTQPGLWSLLSVIVVMTVALIFAAPLNAGAAVSHAPRHMPRLIGLPRTRVFAIMRADDLYFQTRGPGSANATWVTVTAQWPAPGMVVAWHAQATLTTSTTSTRGPRAMPRLIGLNRARVFVAMRKAQLFFTTFGPGSTAKKWVVVLHQSPAPGARVRWHSEANLSVSTRRPAVRRPVPAKKKTTTTTVKKTTTTTVKKSPTSIATTTTTTTVLGSTTTTYPGETTTTTISTPTTTTIKRPTPTTTTTVKRNVVKKTPARSRIGVATWYSYIPGRCATWYLPMGTRVTVRNLATNKAVTCIVTDREAAHGDRVVDLSQTEFARLEPLWRGVVRVKISW
jgi:beta-lactam-binding protein with PASTA domain